MKKRYKVGGEALWNPPPRVLFKYNCSNPATRLFWRTSNVHGDFRVQRASHSIPVLNAENNANEYLSNRFKHVELLNAVYLLATVFSTKSHRRARSKTIRIIYRLINDCSRRELNSKWTIVVYDMNTIKYLCISIRNMIFDFFIFRHVWVCVDTRRNRGTFAPPLLIIGRPVSS